MSRLGLQLLCLVLFHGLKACARNLDSRTCFERVVTGQVALNHCEKASSELLHILADHLSGHSSGCLAETWILLGTRFHDILSFPDEAITSERLSAARCDGRNVPRLWKPYVSHAMRAIVTGLRLLSDVKEAPKQGTHAALSLARVLLHPCTLADKASHPFLHLVHKYAWSNQAEKSSALDQSITEAKALRNAGRCKEAVEAIHATAKRHSSSMNVWYNLQVTMMECRLWNFTLEAKTPLEAMPRKKEIADSCGKSRALVSAASHEYFERLANLVGSIHVWASDIPIVVYDVGLTERQNQQLQGWRNVSVRKLDFSKLPEHVRWTGWEESTYAFKPIVIRKALTDYQCILWLDSGIELRRDVSWAFDWMGERKALFLASGWPFPNSWVHPQSLRSLNVTEESSSFGVFADEKGHASLEVWSGVVGFNQADAKMMRLVVEPWYECALNRECIAPLGSNKTNHRQDQTILSILFYKHRTSLSKPVVFTSTRLRAFAPAHINLLTRDETAFNEILLFQRRGHQPWPYARHLSRLAK
mmetsp:Transcript_17923/g.58874  ORF Transcript_17923/g.58874 Transcript_17923/m.58874 type:complete len:533 (-) Transcript_17923:233-1831(-)